MNKKANTAIFIIAASIFNIGVGVLLLILSMVIILWLFKESQAVHTMATIFAPLIAFAGSFFIYNTLLNVILKKTNLESKLAPIFAKRKKPQPPQ